MCVPGSGASLSLAEEGATVRRTFIMTETSHALPSTPIGPTLCRLGRPVFISRELCGICVVVTSRTVHDQITSLTGLSAWRPTLLGRGCGVHSGDHTGQHMLYIDTLHIHPHTNSHDHGVNHWNTQSLVTGRPSTADWDYWVDLGATAILRHASCISDHLA